MLITLFGRENVGKSTLFNCLIEEKKALVSKEPGTTRDKKYGYLVWRNHNLTLTDTAGFNLTNQTIINKEAQKKLKEALKEADLILFIVDVQTGILPLDRQMAALLKKTKKPYLLVVNKVDDKKTEYEAAPFARLGLGEPQLVSALNGTGTGDLLDAIVKTTIPDRKKPLFPKYENYLKITIAGQPNVGKSSLLNSILGTEKVIVSDVAHTTREQNEIPFQYKKEKLLLVDTAGIVKKAKDQLKKQSMRKSFKAIAQSDIVLLVLDATAMVTNEDQRLAAYIKDRNKGLILVINKWDLIPDKTTTSLNSFAARYQKDFPFFKGVPFIFVSAKNKQRIAKTLDLALKIRSEMNKTISNKELDKFLEHIIRKHSPKAAKGRKKPRILTIEQFRTCPPHFYIVIGHRDTLHFSYLRYIENELRSHFGFAGSPIKLIIKKHK